MQEHDKLQLMDYREYPSEDMARRAAEFYAAEDYHQEYFANNPNAGYCRVVVGPKVAKFKKKLEEKAKLKSEAK